MQLKTDSFGKTRSSHNIQEEVLSRIFIALPLIFKTRGLAKKVF